MIHSTAPFNRPSVPPAADATSRPPRAPVSRPVDKDHLYSGASAHIKAALAQYPEIRSEVVERARLLVQDPTYPPREIIDAIARELLTQVADEA